MEHKGNHGKCARVCTKATKPEYLTLTTYGGHLALSQGMRVSWTGSTTPFVPIRKAALTTQTSPSGHRLTAPWDVTSNTISMLTCRQGFLPNLVLSRLVNVPGRSGKRGDFLGRRQLHHIHVTALDLVPWDEAGFASPENVLDDLLGLDFVLHAQEDGNPSGLLILTVGHHLNGK